MTSSKRASVGLRIALFFLAVASWHITSAMASDHADPIDVLNKERLEGGITDLFLFPVSKSGKVVNLHTRTARLPLIDTQSDILRPELTIEQRGEVDSLVVIMCVRRALTQTGSLKLTPYTYRIHFDLDLPIKYPLPDDPDAMRTMPPSETGNSRHAPSQDHPAHDHSQPHSHAAEEGRTGEYSTQASSGSGPQKPFRPTVLEAFARYGGWIDKKIADEIREEVTIEVRLDDQAALAPGYPKFIGTRANGWSGDSRIRVATGVYDDPFIFPVFFGTNIVAMVMQIPVEHFRKEPGEELHMALWGSSHKGDRQVDHVGRSLRTQNPRFELLNTLHPSRHVKAITEEHDQPGLMRDIALRVGFNQTFAYREWDFVPDVMLYTDRYPVGFPNGRALTDDVAAMLAQHGDTLLYELSYHNASYPRRQTNDREFRETFPFLADKHPDRDPTPPRMLSNRSVMILTLIVVGVVATIIGVWEGVKWLVRWFRRPTRNSQRVL